MIEESRMTPTRLKVIAFNCSLNYTCAETTCGNTAELSCGASCGGFVSECNVCSGPYC